MGQWMVFMIGSFLWPAPSSLGPCQFLIASDYREDSDLQNDCQYDISRA
jgi:hypothetical protein